MGTGTGKRGRIPRMAAGLAGTALLFLLTVQPCLAARVDAGPFSADIPAGWKHRKLADGLIAVRKDNRCRVTVNVAEHPKGTDARALAEQYRKALGAFRMERLDATHIAWAARRGGLVVTGLITILGPTRHMVSGILGEPDPAALKILDSIRQQRR